MDSRGLKKKKKKKGSAYDQLWSGHGAHEQVLEVAGHLRPEQALPIWQPESEASRNINDYQ